MTLSAAQADTHVSDEAILFVLIAIITANHHSSISKRPVMSAGDCMFLWTLLY